MGQFARRMQLASAGSKVSLGILQNPGFELGTTAWSEWHPNGQSQVFGVDSSVPRSGINKAFFWSSQAYQQSIHQAVAVDDGSHLISAWVKLQNFSGETTPGICRMELQINSDTPVYVDIPVTGDTWTRVHGSVSGTGLLNVGFYANVVGGTSLAIDDVAIDVMPRLQNGGFESGMNNWTEWHPNGQATCFATDSNDPRSGNQKGYFWNGTNSYQQSIQQTITIPEGRFTVTAWVKLQNYTGTPITVARMELTTPMSGQIHINIPQSMAWSELKGVVMGPGTLTVGLYVDGSGSTSLQFDDISIEPTPMDSLYAYSSPGLAQTSRYSVQLLQNSQTLASPVYYSPVPMKSVDPTNPGAALYPEDDGAPRGSWTGPSDGPVPRSVSSTTFSYSGVCTVRVTTATPFTTAIVRPLSKGIVPRKVDNNTLEFELYDRLHAKLSVEFDGIDHALFVFADPPEDPSKIVRPGTGVYDHPTNSSWSIPGGTTALRFGPGMHDVGYRVLPSSINKIYIAGGAVVYGAFDVSASNVQITGRGTISGIKWPWRAIKSDGSHATGEVWVEGIKQLDLHCNGGVIEGITFADPSYYSISPNESQNLTFTDIKEVGGWRWNSDGVEPPRGSTAQYVFLHCNDDGLKAYYSDITFRHAVLWKGPNGPAIQTGWDRRWTWNLLVEDIDVIHFEGPQYQGATNNGLVSNQYDRGTIAPNNMHFDTEAQSTDVNARPDMRNLVFRDIRCEEPILRAFAVLAPPGQVMTDWQFERIIMPAQTTPSANNWFTGIYESDLSSYPKGVIRNITFDRVQIGIDKITWDNAFTSIGKFDIDFDSVSGVSFI